MVAAQQLISEKPFDLGSVLTLPEVEHVPFLSILAHTEFED
jgi:hypothetical protein